jgi:hypothetical protein
MICSLLLFSALGFPAQEPEAPPPAPADFRVAFDAPARAIAPGIGTGLNDLANASEGCWETWAEQVTPRGGLARLWASYVIGPVNEQIRAGLSARDAGLEVMLTAVGDPANFGKGDPADLVGIPPRDPAEWARHVARDVKRMQARGVPVTHVEVWNEPNFPGQWNGTEESFAAFFAAAGKELSGLLPGVAIGGPGMATAAGTAQDFFRKLLVASKRAGWAPDFLSWHFYNAFPSDNARLQFGQRLEAMAREVGVATPRMILSEWNIKLPAPTSPELDDHRAGVFFCAVNSALVDTPVVHSQFFFLQDGFWEAKEDYAGQSVGVFTLRGGPKAVLQGMRLFDLASRFPAVPVERGAAPWNLTCLATRQGDRGYLLLTNAFGDPVKSARNLVDFLGVDLSHYQGKERELQAWATGRMSYEKMGGRKEDLEHWQTGRRFLQEARAEMARTSRPVRIAFDETPARIGRVWRLDDRHGDPLKDPGFRARFAQLTGDPHQRVAREVEDTLRQEGVDESRLAVLRDAMAEPDPERGRQRIQQKSAEIGPAVARRAETLYRERFFALRSEVPGTMMKHSAMGLPEVAPGRYLRRDGRDLVVELPPWSAVLVEVAWSEEGAED